LDIDLADRPCAEVIAEVTNTLQFSGAVLEKFKWKYLDPEAFNGVPRLSLAANTSLKALTISLNLPPSPQTIHKTLGALLSDITSPHLQHIRLTFWLFDQQPEILQDAYEVPTSSADTTETISTFHTILSRGIYDQLPGNSVQVTFHLWGRLQFEDRSSIKSRIHVLFAPWLSRGVLELEFHTWADPDTAAHDS